MVRLSKVKVFAAALLLLSLLYLLAQRPVLRSGNSNNADRGDAYSSAVAPVLDHAAAAISESDMQMRAYKQRLLRQLRAYSELPDHPGNSLMLGLLYQQVLHDYPEQGAAMFEWAVKKVFAERAADILSTLALFEQYEAWMLRNAGELANMESDARNRAIWEKRLKLFGENAYKIWSREREQQLQKQSELKLAVQSIIESSLVSNDEKLFLLRSRVAEEAGNSLVPVPAESQTALLQHIYLNIDSVQQELQRLPPDIRQRRLREMRLQLGYSDNQAEKLEQIDLRRQQRWDNGLAYMEARRRLLNSSPGGDLETGLNQLRKKFFAHEAQTIASEESAGFFRFDRPRVYGRN